MLTTEQNETLCQTDPGTPAGDLLRSYWQPAALSEEVPPGGAPIPVRIMGEDLTLFRDDRGRLGLLGLHCAHRAADLSYGRVEEAGCGAYTTAGFTMWMATVYSNLGSRRGAPSRTRPQGL